MRLYENFKQEDLVDLLKAYDCYISNAADAGLLTTGWTPVCVEEFYENEYQNVWDPKKGDACFDYMYEASENFSMEEIPELTPVYEMDAFNGARIFVEAGQTMARFPDDEKKYVLQRRIQDIRDGDAFAVGTGVHVADGDAHQNLDESDCPWIVYDIDGDSWFEEDIIDAQRVYGTKLRESMFIFDEELCVQDEATETIDGYLWATDSLVSRLKEQLQKELSKEELESMENINFYVFYHPGKSSISITSHFYYKDTDGHEKTMSPDILLNDREAASLRYHMMAYCGERYGKSCEEFVAEAKTAMAHEAVFSTLKNKLTNELENSGNSMFIDVCAEVPLNYSAKANHVLVVWGEENGEDDKFYSLAVYRSNEKSEPQEALPGMQIFSDSESFTDLSAATYELLERFDQSLAAARQTGKEGLDSIITGAQLRSAIPSDVNGVSKEKTPDADR